MAVRVIVLILPGDVDRNFSKVAVFEGLLRFVLRSRRLAMSALIDGRVTLSRSAVSAVRELMLVSEAPIVVRSAARPEMNRWSWSISSLRAASWASTVPSTVLRLEIVRPMTSSRSARVEVSEAVLDSSELMLPPSPCRTLMMLLESSLTSFGRQRGEQRLEAVEQHGEVEGRLGVVEAEGRAVLEGGRAADVLGERDVALSHEVAVLDGGLGALGEDAGLEHVELDRRRGRGRRRPRSTSPHRRGRRRCGPPARPRGR